MKIKIDFPPDFRVRYGYGKSDAGHMAALISPGRAGYAGLIAAADARAAMADIPLEAGGDPAMPFWKNPFFPPVDALALATLLRTRNPARYLEIGSGNSTKFARHAIRSAGLRTEITSIDPQPRAEIADIADRIVAEPIETLDLAVFDAIGPGDVVFLDGSHRCLQNSDVAVFFVDILPSLPPGTLVGIHDIFWPRDYPEAWQKRYYSEQYMLAAWLLGRGERARIVFPASYASVHLQDDLRAALPAAVVEAFVAQPGYVGGTSFFFEA
jgi:predicted O-methyltransferase YrrM